MEIWTFFLGGGLPQGHFWVHVIENQILSYQVLPYTTYILSFSLTWMFNFEPLETFNFSLQNNDFPWFCILTYFGFFGPTCPILGLGFGQKTILESPYIV